MPKSHTKRNILIVLFLFLAALLVGSQLYPLTVISVSKLNIDPQGYEDQTTGEWKGSFWMILALTDFDDQVAGFHLASNEGDPSGTYAETLEGKVYAETYTVDGKQLVPTADVMVHITAKQPYFERPLEIQQGYYIEDTYATKASFGGINPRKDTSIKVDGVPFIHYSFGSGSWTLHTPFKVDLYKEGALIATQEIDTVGGTGIYRLPTTGEEFINIIDLGKLGTGYGEPQWDDILYFSENHIFVRSPLADNLLRYDNGVDYTGPESPGYFPGYIKSFSTYWFGHCRWLDDSSPAAFKKNGIFYNYVKDGDFLGWDRDGAEYHVSPKQPDVFGDIIPYLQDQGIQKVSMPTGFSRLEKTQNNNLRVYMKYGSYSSLITIKISTELADTIVWQPQVGNFEITSFPDFGDVTDRRIGSITIKCTEGAGSAQVRFTKDPADAPISLTPTDGTPRLEAGESHTLPVEVLNLGTTQDFEGEIIAKVSNSLGNVTDTARAGFTLLEKIGATTICHVITEYEGKAISNLPVTIAYAGTSQTRTTGLDGIGVATFNLGTSADVTVVASFAGNAIYQPMSKTVSVSGGSEKAITLSLLLIGEEGPDEWNWELIAIAAAIIILAVVIVAVARGRGKKVTRKRRKR